MRIELFEEFLDNKLTSRNLVALYINDLCNSLAPHQVMLEKTGREEEAKLIKSIRCSMMDVGIGCNDIERLIVLFGKILARFDTHMVLLSSQADRAWETMLYTNVIKNLLEFETFLLKYKDRLINNDI